MVPKKSAKKSASTKKESTKTATKKTAKKAKKSTAKKATKKKAAKKSSAKKTAKKKSTKKTAKKSPSKAAQKKAADAAAKAMQDIIARARDHFRQAPEEHAFHLRDGRRLRDLRDLVEALEDMHEHVFVHHVNDDRHDFASWVHEVLKERALAEELREAQKHPQRHQHVIFRHIVRRTW